MINFYIKVGKRVMPIEDPFFQFPGGEWHMNPEPEHWMGKHIAILRGSDPNDFIKLAMWSQVVQDQGGQTHAIIPYFPAARADRGVPFGLEVYSNLLISAKLDKLHILDPHSPVLEQQVDAEFHYSEEFLPEPLNARGIKYDYVLAPDAGATDRAGKIADALDIPSLQATKSRDPKTGHLSNVQLHFDNIDNHCSVLVVDDICDGGRTFSNLIDEIRKSEVLLWGRVDLFVTHGIFSGNAGQNLKHYDTIITTDSLLQTTQVPDATLPVVQNLLKKI